jgi:hypothetical protein
MQLVGPAPIANASGTGAQVISPVQFSKDVTPIGGEVSMSPQIHGSGTITRLDGSTVPQIADFQQLFDVTLKLPTPPAPIGDFSCSDEVFPFRVAQDVFEDEGQSIQHLHDWFESLDPVVQDKIRQGAFRINVTGHASTTGNQSFNLQLAEKRAKRVSKILQDFAGTDAHLDIFAFGKLEAQEKGEVAHERRADYEVQGNLDSKASALIKDRDNICRSGVPFRGPGSTTNTP